MLRASWKVGNELGFGQTTFVTGSSFKEIAFGDELELVVGEAPQTSNGLDIPIEFLQETVSKNASQ